MTETNSRIVNAIAARSRDGKLPCVSAEEIAGQLSVPMQAIGQALDEERIKITACQLGLFGVSKKKQDAPPTNPAALSKIQALSPKKSLTCAELWEIARELSIPRADVGAACNAEGIKITHCQLGAF